MAAKNNRLRWLMGGATIGVAVLLVLVLKHQRKTETMEHALQREAQAYLDDNAGTIYALSPKEERDVLKLNGEKVQHLLDWSRSLVRPVAFAGPPSIRGNTNDDAAVGDFFYRTKTGQTAMMSFIGYRTEDGPIVYMSDVLTMGTMNASYADRFPQAPETRRVWHAVNYGLKLHQKELESIGIPGYSSTDGTPGLHTWSALSSRAARLIQD